MPRYDYGCAAGHTTESVQGYGTEAIPCPVCGGEARRAAVYRDQFIRGETVATGRTMRSGAKDEKGRYNLGHVNEAQATIFDACERQGAEMPDFQKAGAREARKRGAKVKQLA